jgi:chemotaxis protein CheD
VTKTIYMGQFDTVRSPDTLKTTLGSCVGLVLYDPHSDVFGMAHIMLPQSDGTPTTTPGKYANTAIAALIAKMGASESVASRLRAKLAGGATMFSSLAPARDSDILKVGEKNTEVTLQLLKSLGILVLGTDLGGNQGRELTIDALSGKVWVRCIGHAPKEL